MNEEIAARATIAYFTYADAMEVVAECSTLQEAIERIQGRQRLLMEFIHCVPPRNQLN